MGESLRRGLFVEQTVLEGRYPDHLSGEIHHAEIISVPPDVHSNHIAQARAQTVHLGHPSSDFVMPAKLSDPAGVDEAPDEFRRGRDAYPAMLGYLTYRAYGFVRHERQNRTLV